MSDDTPPIPSTVSEPNNAAVAVEPATPDTTTTDTNNDTAGASSSSSEHASVDTSSTSHDTSTLSSLVALPGTSTNTDDTELDFLASALSDTAPEHETLSEPPHILPRSSNIPVDSLHDTTTGHDPDLEHDMDLDNDALDDDIDVDGDVEGWADGDNHELKRVKVYELIGQRWVDQGTAFCTGHYDDDTSTASLIARSEADFRTIILQTTIRSQEQYQRQQDTLIVWTEPSGADYALSFQDPEGCAAVWQFIEDVQGHLAPSDDNRATMDSGDGPATSLSDLTMTGPRAMTIPEIVRSGHLPPPQLGFLPQVDKAIKALARTPALKERVCDYIQAEEYVKLMIDTLAQAEDLESLPDLHALCGLMQTIITLNDHGIFEHIIDDDVFLGVVGMLEYDPDFPNHKANYRLFLRDTAAFHQPVPIRDSTVARKVHGTYRLQFLKDVVLARTLDDATFNVLSSAILFNQIDIVAFVQQDAAFLPELVGVFCDEHTLRGGALSPRLLPPLEAAEGERLWNNEGDPRRAEVTLLAQQLCSTGKAIQLPARLGLFRALVERGILFCPQWALGVPEKHPAGPRLIAAAGDVLGSVLDHALEGVRAHVNRQVVRWRDGFKDKTGSAGKEEGKGREGEKAETVLLVMCRVMARSRDLAVQSLVGDALKVILEVPVPEAEGLAGGGMGAQMKMMGGGGMGGMGAGGKAGNPEADRFIAYFYADCADVLFKPLGDVPEAKTFAYPVLELTREKANLYLYLCDILTAAAQQHKVEGHNWIHRSHVAGRIATLLSARDKHLRLAALRFFRMLIKLDKLTYFDYLKRNAVFGPILALTIRESKRDNLLSASCQELFEHLRRENPKHWIEHVMTDHGDAIRTLAEIKLGGSIFQGFIRRWEQNNEPMPPPDDTVKLEPAPDTRAWGQGRAPDAEEEDYFLHDDDDDDISMAGPSHPNNSTPRPSSPLEPISAFAQSLKRKRARPAGIPGAPPTTIKLPSNLNTNNSAKKNGSALVDYADDDEDDGTASVASAAWSEGEEGVPPSKSPSPAPSEGGTPGPVQIPSTPTLTHRNIRHPQRAINGSNDTGSNGSGAGPSSPPGSGPLDTDALMAGAPPSPSLAQSSSPPKGLVPPSAGLGLLPMRAGEKRRRGAAGEGDEEDTLERLAKTRRNSISVSSTGKGAGEDEGKQSSPTKKEESGATTPTTGKKMTMKLGSMMGVFGVKPAPAPTETSTGTKDGEAG